MLSKLKSNQRGALDAGLLIVIIVMIATIGLVVSQIIAEDDELLDDAETSELEGEGEEGEAELQEDEEEASLESSSAPLLAVDGSNSSGTADRSFVDGVFMHSVEADMPAPPAGTFYEGWLVGGEGGFFSTGVLELQDGQYVLTYESDVNYYDYPEVVITQETEANGLDGNPEKHILEGEFKD